MQWILPLERVNLTHIAAVGGKAARLGALAQAGFEVPKAVVITADAFRAHLPTFEPYERPPTPKLTGEFVHDLADAIAQQFEPDTLFAVRSSAIDEDGYGASFAGQHATYYFVTPDQVSEAVIDCWLSIWTDAAIAYRSEWGEPPQPMAVILQRMVAADRAGVSFSQDPSDPTDQRTVIESVWGLGAALVDGRATPDRLHVSRRGRVTTTQIGDKQVYVPARPQMASTGRLAPVEDGRRERATLSDDEAREIAEATEQIERLFDHPVDVEWAYESGRLQLLQARPITTMLTSDEHSERLVIFKPVAENFSHPLTPMSEDLYRRVIPKVGRFVRGRLYIHFDLVKRFLPFKLDDASMADVLLLKDTATPSVSFRRLPQTVVLLLGLYLTNGVFWHRSAQLTEASLARVRQVIDRARTDRHDARTTLRRLLHGRHPFQAMHHYIFQINVSSGRYFLLLGLLRRLLARWAPNFDQSAIPNLCHGGNDMISTRMVDAIQELAQIARVYGDCSDALKADSPLQALSTLPEDHPFNESLAAFLHTYGHRGGREVELAAPRWREDVGALLPMIASQIKTEDSGTDLAYARHLGARDQLHQALGNGWRRRLIDYVALRIRYYIVLRENTRHYHTMIMDVVRHKLLAFENRLMSERKLHCEGDLFYLTWDEACDLAEGTITPEAASQTVRTRRIHWQNAAKRLPPDRYNIPTHAAEDSEDTLTGTCACPGEAAGVAKIVMNPTEAAKLEPGDIMIAPYTDPTWTPLFPSLAGIVVGIGSYLSHAGTIAREYQIPCIVDVTGCTEQIQDGSRVQLNATQGTVHLQAAGI